MGTENSVQGFQLNLFHLLRQAQAFPMSTTLVYLRQQLHQGLLGQHPPPPHHKPAQHHQFMASVLLDRPVSVPLNASSIRETHHFPYQPLPGPIIHPIPFIQPIPSVESTTIGAPSVDEEDDWFGSNVEKRKLINDSAMQTKTSATISPQPPLGPKMKRRLAKPRPDELILVEEEEDECDLGTEASSEMRDTPSLCHNGSVVSASSEQSKLHTNGSTPNGKSPAERNGIPPTPKHKSSGVHQLGRPASRSSSSSSDSSSVRHTPTSKTGSNSSSSNSVTASSTSGSESPSSGSREVQCATCSSASTASSCHCQPAASTKPSDSQECGADVRRLTVVENTTQNDPSTPFHPESVNGEQAELGLDGSQRLFAGSDDVPELNTGVEEDEDDDDGDVVVVEEEECGADLEETANIRSTLSVVRSRSQNVFDRTRELSSNSRELDSERPPISTGASRDANVQEGPKKALLSDEFTRETLSSLASIANASGSPAASQWTAAVSACTE
ncbi:hypothetical protein X801_08291, partial [Opisthorchis viverrini]